MNRAENFVINAKCTHGHRSAMSNSAWCELITSCTVLKLHDMCHNPKCNCQKQITFTPQQFQLEGGSIKRKLQKLIKGTRTAWQKLHEPALKITSPNIGMAVGARTKNPQIGKDTSDILKSGSRGKVLSKTDMDGNGLRLRGM